MTSLSLLVGTTVQYLRVYIIIDVPRPLTNIQLMHSFEVNIRICQPENSEHHFRGLTNPDVNQKRMHQLFCYMTLLFLIF